MISPTCIFTDGLVGQMAAGAANGVLGEIAKAIQDGVTWVIGNTVSWWVKIPSPDLATESAVDRMRQWTLPIAVAVAVLGVISSGAKMALSRKASPLADVGSGLMVMAATSTIGVLIASLLVKAGDAWSDWILNASTHGDFGERLTKVLTLGAAAPGVVIVLGVIAILAGVVQAVLMLFREAALVILAGLLPLAAAGSMTTLTKPWFRKLTGWMLALICYKPAAAAVYATTFTMLGNGKDARTIVMGFAMMVLSLVALPVLMKFFTWTTGSLATVSGGGGLLGASIAGAVAVGTFRGGGGSASSSAITHADFLSAQLGGGRGGNGAPPTSPSGAAPAAAGAGAAPGTTTGSGAGSATSGASGSASADSTSAGTARAATAGSAAGPAGTAAAASAAVVGNLANGARTAANSMREDHQR
ncbi:hypothetical protein ACQP1K_17470 [Sphaerimonospora sp. CA-214678]|uniref:hypothetical protein n=1 Tax=Sphaerimonospora sp. CA-214678 TaxID=3240029 RepID=UPI003D901043